MSAWTLPYRDEPTPIELEILPTGGWGCDVMSAAIRYARTLGKPYLTMTGRFHWSWGGFGGIRTQAGLLFDGCSSIANGGTCSIGDHRHPRGVPEPAVYRLIGEVCSQVRALEPWTAGARAVAEIAVPEVNGYQPVVFEGGASRRQAAPRGRTRR